MSHPSSLIEITDLSFSYEKDFPIISGCNLSISQGDFIGIIGPNGGGKTTFLKLLMGFLTPDRGSISLFGKSPKQARSIISYVPQSNSFDKEFPISVMEFILTGCIAHLSPLGNFCKSARHQTEEILEKMGLWDLRHQHFGSLSGGQAQRVTIARALVTHPQILILDEPTANVDSLAEQAILSLLESLKNKMTILLVSHDLHTTVKYANRILCIQKNVTEMAPEEVCHHYALGLYHPLKFKN